MSSVTFVDKPAGPLLPARPEGPLMLLEQRNNVQHGAKKPAAPDGKGCEF